MIGETVKLPLYGKGNYVSWVDLSPIFPELNTSHKPTSLITSINSPQGKIAFRIGASFFTFDNKISKLPKPPQIKEDDLYLPIDLVEAIFLNLIAYDFRYKF